MLNASLKRAGATVCDCIVKLFDELGCLASLNQPDGAEKPAIADDSDNIQRITQVVERIAVDNYEVRARTRCDAPRLQTQAERIGGINTCCSQRMFSIEAGAG